jgi:DGQHR domain-containing protein
MEDDPSIENLEIPVAIFENLNTTDCASIFLSINTQQKPVPSSLVYDLYGVADESVVDPAATRARDIAIALNEDEDSPYYEQIKLPGSPRRKGGIALSTAATAIKPLVEPKGDFEQRGITQFETQKQVIKNLFSALSEHYGEGWYETTNAFMYAAGFTGAIDFLRTKLLSYGHTHKSYTQQTFFDAIRMQRNDLILQQEVKGKGGKDAPAIILDRLNGMFAPKEGSAEAFEV